MTAAETMRDLLAPVAMISANGLMCLALYNRLTAVITRLRMFDKERFDVHSSLVEYKANRHRLKVNDPLLVRLADLEHQCRLISRRARWLRDALLMMLAGVIGMLSSSLAIGLSHVWPELSSVGLVIFVTGIVCMMVGILFAVRELTVSLDPLHAESGTLTDLDEERAKLQHDEPKELAGVCLPDVYSETTSARLQ